MTRSENKPAYAKISHNEKYSFFLCYLIYIYNFLDAFFDLYQWFLTWVQSNPWDWQSCFRGSTNFIWNM